MEQKDSEVSEGIANIDVSAPAGFLPESAKQSDAAKFALAAPKEGAFIRSATKFHDKISADPSAKYPAESGRYWLYISLACPWAHRCYLTRAIKGLKEHIPVVVVNPVVKDMMVKDKYLGWAFNSEDTCGESAEPHGFQTVSELYELASPGFRETFLSEGKRPYYSVPILFDSKTNTIVSNESADIVRFFNTEFAAFASPNALDLYPPSLQGAIDKVNVWVYPEINDGVYRSGFAGSQEAYNEAVGELFAALDRAEEILSTSAFMAGDVFTEADLRLWVTLIRFDACYVSHFKCNLKRIADFPKLSQYVRSIYQHPFMKEGTSIWHIKNHYFRSHPQINAFGIVPAGPELGLDEPTSRPPLVLVN